MGPALWQRLQRLHEAGTDAVLVTVMGARGSVPADLGAKMIVTRDGLDFGTVGGGKVESQAIGVAAEMLAAEDAEICRSAVWNLQRDVGMTCGGEMTFLFELVRAVPPWRIFIFGAGHVVQALLPVILPLDCRVTVFDVRKDWLDKLPAAENLDVRLVGDFQDGVGEVTPDGFVLSITKGHSTDVPVLRDLFRKFDGLPFVGVIGSRSKRAVLVRELRESGISAEKIESLVCPLGLSIGGNAPAEIAISISAQLLGRRDLR